ncbi:hypothetical protein CCMA1212_008112 [Trichoderma ghanense]|uniref:Uncharacterized protein n=1 Tax=Trichoderma ghanense TaxID=65468 RepID=A0ABY2GYW0_9HYPO
MSSIAYLMLRSKMYTDPAPKQAPRQPSSKKCSIRSTHAASIAHTSNAAWLPFWPTLDVHEARDSPFAAAGVTA